MNTVQIKCDGFLCLTSSTHHDAIETISRVYPNGETHKVDMCKRCSNCAQGVWDNVTVTVI
jgi:HEPN domain-containing protein